jgi:hypothetical protein
LTWRAIGARRAVRNPAGGTIAADTADTAVTDSSVNASSRGNPRRTAVTAVAAVAAVAAGPGRICAGPSGPSGAPGTGGPTRAGDAGGRAATGATCTTEGSGPALAATAVEAIPAGAASTAGTAVGGNPDGSRGAIQGDVRTEAPGACYASRATFATCTSQIAGGGVKEDVRRPKERILTFRSGRPVAGCSGVATVTTATASAVVTLC